LRLTFSAVPTLSDAEIDEQLDSILSEPVNIDDCLARMDSDDIDTPTPPSVDTSVATPSGTPKKKRSRRVFPAAERQTRSKGRLDSSFTVPGLVPAGRRSSVADAVVQQPVSDGVESSQQGMAFFRLNILDAVLSCKVVTEALAQEVAVPAPPSPAVTSVAAPGDTAVLTPKGTGPESGEESSKKQLDAIASWAGWQVVGNQLLRDTKFVRGTGDGAWSQGLIQLFSLAGIRAAFAGTPLEAVAERGYQRALAPVDSALLDREGKVDAEGRLALFTVSVIIHLLWLQLILRSTSQRS
jgi:hypothetical protein